MNLPLALGALALGSVVGSFAATAGLRWARGEQALTGRSRCDACAAPLGFGQTVPIVSYVCLRGTCAKCGVSISPVHLAGEVVGASVALASFALLPISAALLVMGLGLTLIAAAIADLTNRRLPNLANLLVAGLGGALAVQRGLFALLVGLAASALTAVMLMLVRQAFFERKRLQYMGLGDVKLAAALALWLGAATPWMISAAGVLGLVQAGLFKSAKPGIAFGPMLALVGWTMGLALQAGLFGDLIP